MEESHAKLRDRPCLEDRPSAARGLYLQGSACCSEARVVFKCFPFGECGNPATLVVWRFQHIITSVLKKKRLSPSLSLVPNAVWHQATLLYIVYRKNCNYNRLQESLIDNLVICPMDIQGFAVDHEFGHFWKVFRNFPVYVIPGKKPLWAVLTGI